MLKMDFVDAAEFKKEYPDVLMDFSEETDFNESYEEVLGKSLDNNSADPEKMLYNTQKKRRPQQTCSINEEKIEKINNFPHCSEVEWLSYYITDKHSEKIEISVCKAFEPFLLFPTELEFYPVLQNAFVRNTCYKVLKFSPKVKEKISSIIKSEEKILKIIEKLHPKFLHDTPFFLYSPSRKKMILEFVSGIAENDTDLLAAIQEIESTKDNSLKYAILFDFVDLRNHAKVKQNHVVFDPKMKYPAESNFIAMLVKSNLISFLMRKYADEVGWDNKPYAK